MHEYTANFCPCCCGSVTHEREDGGVLVSLTGSAVPAMSGDVILRSLTLCNHSALPITHVRITGAAFDAVRSDDPPRLNGQPMSTAEGQGGFFIPAIGPGTCARITFTTPKDSDDNLETPLSAVVSFLPYL